MAPILIKLPGRQAPLAGPPRSPLDMSTNAPTILAINGSFTGFTLLVILARIYVRSIMLKTFGADDYFITAAMVVE